jgi:dynein heavy chain
VNEAKAEGKIEAELGKIELTWRNNVLEVVKYKKDGQDRGFVLRSAEELKVTLISPQSANVFCQTCHIDGK